MNQKYSRKELENVGGSEFPKKGLYCKSCKTWIPQFEELDEKSENYILTLIENGEKILAMRALETIVGCNKRWSKIWVIHGGKPSPEFKGPPCPFCGKKLRTSNAKQCPHCFKSWHHA